jgi:hypothetical protein
MKQNFKTSLLCGTVFLCLVFLFALGVPATSYAAGKGTIQYSGHVSASQKKAVKQVYRAFPKKIRNAMKKTDLVIRVYGKKSSRTSSAWKINKKHPYDLAVYLADECAFASALSIAFDSDDSRLRALEKCYRLELDDLKDSFSSAIQKKVRMINGMYSDDYPALASLTTSNSDSSQTYDEELGTYLFYSYFAYLTDGKQLKAVAPKTYALLDGCMDLILAGD